MSELVCITCPIGCHLTIEPAAGDESDGGIVVSGNRCPRGVVYAKEETFSPRRTVTATCRVVRECSGPACVDPLSPAPRSSAGSGDQSRPSLTAPRRLPCRSTAAFPKGRIDELLAAIYRLEVPLPVECGQVLIADALGTGIDVIVTRSMT